MSGIAAMPARDRAYHDLRYRILTGRLAPGTTLLETELAALLSLSRTPVREATIRLAEEGLISIRPRHGITVLNLTLSDVRDILDVLSALEIRAVELVALRGLSDAEHDGLLQLLDRMERLTEAGDIAQWSNLDDDFHSSIAALCGNARLLRTLDEYWGQQYRPRMMIVPLRPKPTQSNIEHRRIVQALADRDAEAAREAQQKHRARADRQQLDLLRGRMADSGLGA
ncbi:GntR family transcriptional regulator [Paracoccus tegillarcae]|uniref:GntR family transcriptional regulator n=1 Tax=Paracoccus tegillarcae TaxID=1529068 RepID=A0A2K9EWK8_9RHOB|nr:GntR family transcriptional regulator [Paracoccus tegillarcae]